MAIEGAIAGALGGGLLGAMGGIFAARDQTRFRRRQRRAIQKSREFADEAVSRLTGSELFANAQGFLTKAFTSDSSFARDAALQIRQQQAVRGTFTGNLSGFQEAIASSAQQQQFRASLLGQAQSFATLPEMVRQQVMSHDAPFRVAASTGALIQGLASGPNMTSALAGGFSGAVSGGLGGAQIGSALGSQIQAQREQAALFQEQLNALRSMRNPAPAAPVPAEFRSDLGLGQSGLFSRLSQLGGVV